MSLPFLYQLQDADHASLSATDFRVAVVDPDDSGLTAEQVTDLQVSQDKLLYAYTSIGEAESYRSYWLDSWTTSPPEYVLGENDRWQGNFRVEFWNADWQAIIYDRVDAVVAAGYDGIYLDIVDGYTVDEVIAAYPGTEAELRQEMIEFVQGISAHAKAQNPDFAIVPQNAVGLLALSEEDGESGPNTAYLDAIDGLGGRGSVVQRRRRIGLDARRSRLHRPGAGGGEVRAGDVLPDGRRIPGGVRGQRDRRRADPLRCRTRSDRRDRRGERHDRSGHGRRRRHRSLGR